MLQVAIAGESGKVFIEAADIQLDGAKPVSRGIVKDLAQEEVAENFAAVLGFVRRAVNQHSPKELEVELSLEITTEGNFIIVKGDASATIKIKANWGE